MLLRWLECAASIFHDDVLRVLVIVPSAYHCVKGYSDLGVRQVLRLLPFPRRFALLYSSETVVWMEMDLPGPDPRRRPVLASGSEGSQFPWRAVLGFNPWRRVPLPPSRLERTRDVIEGFSFASRPPRGDCVAPHPCVHPVSVHGRQMSSEF